MSQQRADQLVEAGLWLKLSGDTQGARRLFEQALRLDPDNARAKQLMDAKPPPPVPAEPPARGPPGTQSPASNAAPSGSRSLIEQDWAMATGILVERGMTPPPVAPNARAQVPDTPWSGPAVSRGDEKPWETEAAGAPPPSTLIMGIPTPKPPTIPPVARVVEDPHETTKPFGTKPRETTPPPTTPTQVWGQVTPQRPAEVESAWDRGARPPEAVPAAPVSGKAMDLVANPVPTFTPPPVASNKRVIEDEVRTLLKGAKDLLDLDDHTGAIDLILKAQELAPQDPQVNQMRERSEQTLQTMFESKLGSMEQRPRVVLKDDEIIWLNLDHRAGFVLAQIDGSVSFEDVFAVSGMSRLDTARILAQLMDEGVIKA